MIVGVGVDVVDVARFAATLERSPALAGRLFCDGELGLPAHSMAARFAAKEALAKSLGAPGDLLWHDAEVIGLESGEPRLQVRGSVADRLAALGGAHLHLSLSHDGGLATAVVVAESG